MLARAVAFVLAALVLVVTFRAVDGAHVLALLRRVGPVAVVVLLPYGLSMALENAGWVVLLTRVGQRLPYWPLYKMVLAGEALQAALPAGVVFAEAIKPPLFQTWCGVRAPLALAAMAARKYLRLVALVLYLLLSFALGFGALHGLSRTLLGGAGLEWSVLAMAAGVALAVFSVGAAFRRGALARRVHELLVSIPIRRLRERLTEGKAGFDETDAISARLFAIPARDLAAPVAFALSAWLLESVETWLILRLIGVDLAFGSVIAFEAGLMLVRQLVFVFPAGLGLQDLGYLMALRALGVPDSLAVAAAFSVLKRGKEAVWIAIGAAILAGARASRGPRPLRGAPFPVPFESRDRPR